MWLGRSRGFSRVSRSGVLGRSQNAWPIEPQIHSLGFLRALVHPDSKARIQHIYPTIKRVLPCTPITTGGFVILMVFKWLVTLITNLTH